MDNRRLGRGGLRASALGLGTMGMGGSYGPVDEAEATATVQRALDLGVTLIDTADFYGPDGAGEKVVGTALAGRRDEAVIASKTGMEAVAGGPPRVNGRPEFIKARIDASLTRLGTDRVDLYYLARVDPDVPVEESIGALGELVVAGKVGHIGLCEASATTVRRAHAVHPVAAVQTEYSLWERHVEREILPTLRELGVSLVAYRPLGSGFLSGDLTMDRLAMADFRRNDPRLRGDNLYRNMTLLPVLYELAENKGVTPAQLALAWLLARGEDVIPIPGTKRRTYLQQNVAALEVVLTPDEIQGLGDVIPAALGERYPAPLLSTIDV
ncbi:aldo/keto reductase [Streptomyces canus]|uniref:aldo/keto reductase n=1 Tax=Streptomyces canus TaxID=58343 RepID=UPI0022567782|nr:aldo/keto reductase [Streptomyces canus]MCX5261953.1 aldo/keto reductase [Streptomyces canus]